MGGAGGFIFIVPILFVFVIAIDLIFLLFLIVFVVNGDAIRNCELSAPYRKLSMKE